MPFAWLGTSFIHFFYLPLTLLLIGILQILLPDLQQHLGTAQLADPLRQSGCECHHHPGHHWWQCGLGAICAGSDRV